MSGAEGKVPKWKEWAIEQVNDLTVLEVNTIVKDDITARPIGSLADAIFEIAADYSSRVERHGVQIPDARTTIVDTRRLVAIAKAANGVLADKQDTLSAQQVMVLKRIRGNCAELCGVFERLPEKGLQVKRDEMAAANRALSAASPMDQSRVRKIRDIGTEVVVAQSRIHLDGDVITRISSSCLEGERGASMLRVHRDGVDRSIQFWNTLADLGMKVLKQIFKVTTNAV